MKYEEIKQDLFKTEKKYALWHCVAQDGGLGAGIATQFCKLFGNRLRGIIRDANPSNPDVVYYYSNNRKRGVYNIVTKKYSTENQQENLLTNQLKYLEIKWLKMVISF